MKNLMKYFSYLFVLSIMLFSVGCTVKNKESTPEDGLMTNELSQKEMKQDLKILVDTLKEGHVDLYHKVTEKEFTDKVSEIEAKIPTMNSDQFSFELMKLCALVSDTATRTYLDSDRVGNQYYLPIEYSVYAEGLLVTKIDKNYKEKLGGKIISINGTLVDDVIKGLSKYYGGELEDYSLNAGRSSLSFWNMLNDAGFAPEKDVKVAIEKDGSTEEITLTAYKNGDFDYDELASAKVKLPTDYTSKNYSYSLLDTVLYIQYNVCTEMKDQGLSKFVDELKNFLNPNIYKKVVLDLRYNLGSGNYTHGSLLYNALQKYVEEGGKVYTFIGKNTKNHAIGVIIQLRTMFDFVVVGQKTINPAFYYGGSTSFLLPRSQLSVTFPTKTVSFIKSMDKDNMKAIDPSLEVFQSYSDYQNGIDTLLTSIN